MVQEEVDLVERASEVVGVVSPLDEGEVVGRHPVGETTRIRLQRGKGNVDCAARKVSHLFLIGFILSPETLCTSSSTFFTV